MCRPTLATDLGHYIFYFYLTCLRPEQMPNLMRESGGKHSKYLFWPISNVNEGGKEQSQKNNFSQFPTMLMREQKTRAAQHDFKL